MASNELVVKIKADGTNAEAELRKVEAHLKRLAGTGGIADVQKGFKSAASQASNFVSIITGDRLTGATSQITAFSGAIGGIPGPAGLAVGTLVGLSAIVVTLGAGLFELTKKASEYGSIIHDASDKTGLTAETITTLKIAADNAGSSLETVTAGTAKFAKLIGQAADGNRTAQKTLKDLGVTSYDLDTALGQIYQSIFKASDGTQQMSLAMKAFGKAGAEQIPVIKQIGGDLDAARKEAERLGETLSSKDVNAADAFGDALGVLKAQAEAAAVVFTSDLMPILTRFFTNTSEWYAQNKEAVRAWGAAVADGFLTVQHAAEGHEMVVRAALNNVNQGLGDNAARWVTWSNIARGALAVVTLGASELDRVLNPAKKGGNAPWSGTWSRPTPAPNLFGPGGGGGKGGGGGGGQNKDFQEAKKREEELIKIYNDSAASRAAINDLALTKMEIDEEEHAKEQGQIELDKLAYAKERYEALLKLEHINQQQHDEIQGKIDETDTKTFTQKVKNAEALVKIAAKNAKEENDLVYNLYKQRLENERKRYAEHQEILAQQRKRANDRARLEVDPSGNKQDALRQKNDLNLSILGDSVLSVRDQFGNLTNQFKPTLAVFQMMGGAVHSLAEGFGQLLQNIILTGTAGPHAIRKLVASVLAGVASQAAVLAIMELAYGIAAATSVWGRIQYGNPAGHFKAAALFGIVAATAGGLGRAVAGNSFASGGAGSSSNAGAPDYYTNPATIVRGPGSAAGSGTPANDTPIRRLAGAVEALHAKISSMSPRDVVTVGVDQNPGLIGQTAVNDVRRNSQIGADMQTAMGFAR